MSKFLLELTVDDDNVETVADLRDLMEQAWALGNTGLSLSFEGTRANGGKVALAVDVETFSTRVKLLREGRE